MNKSACNQNFSLTSILVSYNLNYFYSIPPTMTDNLKQQYPPEIRNVVVLIVNHFLIHTIHSLVQQSQRILKKNIILLVAIYVKLTLRLVLMLSPNCELMLWFNVGLLVWTFLQWKMEIKKSLLQLENLISAANCANTSSSFYGILSRSALFHIQSFFEVFNNLT